MGRKKWSIYFEFHLVSLRKKNIFLNCDEMVALQIELFLHAIKIALKDTPIIDVKIEPDWNTDII